MQSKPSSYIGNPAEDGFRAAREENRARTLADDVEAAEKSADPLLRIAAEQLGLATLEIRGRDRLDFREHHVKNIKRALQAAYEAGKAAR